MHSRDLYLAELGNSYGQRWSIAPLEDSFASAFDFHRRQGDAPPPVHCPTAQIWLRCATDDRLEQTADGAVLHVLGIAEVGARAAGMLHWFG